MYFNSHLFGVSILPLIFSALLNLQSTFCQTVSVFCLYMLEDLIEYCPEAAEGRRAYKILVSGIQKAGFFKILFWNSCLEIASLSVKRGFGVCDIYPINVVMYFWWKGDGNTLKLKEDVFITTFKGV